MVWMVFIGHRSSKSTFGANNKYLTANKTSTQERKQITICFSTYRVSQKIAAEAFQPRLNAVGPNFPMDMTWRRLIPTRLSRKRPKKQFLVEVWLGLPVARGAGYCLLSGYTLVRCILRLAIRSHAENLLCFPLEWCLGFKICIPLVPRPAETYFARPLILTLT